MNTAPGCVYTFDEYEIDSRLFELRRRGIPQPLEPQVFDVLAYLVQNHDRLITKDELIERIWPEKYISEAALSSRVMAARKALGDSGKAQRFIRTMHGRGFRFVAQVKVLPGERGTEAASLPELAPASATEAGPPPNQEIRFARSSDGVQIAYAIAGSGPPLVKAANWLTHIEYDFESPIWGYLFREIASRRTLIRYDERGVGLSDRDIGGFTIDDWVADLEAVVDTLGLERFPILGISQGGAVAVAYAAKHPERVTHLILHGAYTRGWRTWRSDGRVNETGEALIPLLRTSWGRETMGLRQAFSAMLIPDSRPEDLEWLTKLQRVSASRDMAARFMDTFGNVTVEAVMPQVKTPSLVFHSQHEEMVPFSEGRRTAALLSNARLVPLESRNHVLLEREPAWQVFRQEMWRFLDEGG